MPKGSGHGLRSLPSPPTRADLLAGAAVAEIPWHYSGKQTIAEFAENAEIIQMLTSLGVDYAQGYGVAQRQRVLKSAVA